MQAVKSHKWQHTAYLEQHICLIGAGYTPLEDAGHLDAVAGVQQCRLVHLQKTWTRLCEQLLLSAALILLSMNITVVNTLTIAASYTSCDFDCALP